MNHRVGGGKHGRCCVFCHNKRVQVPCRTPHRMCAWVNEINNHRAHPTNNNSMERLRGLRKGGVSLPPKRGIPVGSNYSISDDESVMSPLSTPLLWV